jgi:16S rRNA G527 N7-methylase RsmG
MTFSELLGRDFDLSPLQLSQLESHCELLLRWNRKLNLTRIEELEDVVRLHYGESLFLAQCLPPGPLRIVDVGSGGGFPGIPLAVSRPECQVTLVESHQRKAVFLREATRDQANVTVAAKRAEGLGDSFDWVVARAVAPAEIFNLGLAGRVALLMTEADLPGLLLPEAVHKLPWGNQRVLAMFHVEHDRI